MTRKLVCQVDQIPQGGMKAFDLDGTKKVLMLKSESGIYACQSVCPHQEICLEEGLFDGSILTCHQHLWQWNVETGEAVGLAEEPLEVYKVQLDGQTVYIED